MKTTRMELKIARILLIALPLSCGPRTFYEPAPAARCGPDFVVAVPPSQWQLDGSTSDAGSSQGFVFDSSRCDTYCGTHTSFCELALADAGAPGVRCLGICPSGSYGVGCGRRPAELPPLAEGSSDALARYFEQATYLEAASVHAFRRLAAELRSHGAPLELSAAAERAAEQERKHTRAMAQLARRYGGQPRGPQRGPRHIRSLIDIAQENAVEGCVRETYGALLAWLQAERASDPHVRRVFRSIARDETEHAELAWSVARFLDTRLPRAERRAIGKLRRAAVQALDQEVSAALPESLQAVAGLPSPVLARRIIAAAQQTMWG